MMSENLCINYGISYNTRNMIQVNYRSIIWCAVFVIVTLFALFLFPWHLNEITLVDIWTAIGKTVTISFIIFTLFIKRFWRYKLFKFIIPIPYLGGEWEGVIKYNWNDHSCEKKIKLTIRQSLFHVLFIIETDESVSRSCSASFNIDELRGENEVIYSYSNQPSIRNRSKSPIHFGAARLTICDNNSKLQGYYWTDRKTIGELVFHKKQ